MLICISGYKSSTMKIAFSGKARSGKDTSTEIFKNIISRELDEDCSVLSFASSLYKCTHSIQKTIGAEVGKDPELLQTLADLIKKKYGKDVFANILCSKLEKNQSKHIIVSDLRYKNEYAMLKKKGFVLIRINRPSRPIDRDQDHSSETELDLYPFNYVVDNSGDLVDLQLKLENIFRSLVPK